MMKQPPLILLAFANAEGDHLDMLKQEGQELKRALRPLEQRGFIRVEKEDSTTTNDLIEILAAYKDQLLLFHYGGHAGSTLLELENKPAQAEGLAKLLGDQKNLKLVFLNGCSTKKQVEKLFSVGIKAVIATSVPVNDEKAGRLAAAFYQALANKRTIKRAFDFAQAALLSEFRDAPKMEVSRGFDLDNIKETAMPWTLYVQPEYENEVLNWQLPYYAKQGLPGKMLGYIEEQFEVNYYIVLVLDEMCRYNPDIYHKMVEVRDGTEKRKDSSTFLDLVIENFPWVIGSQLRLLLIYDQPNRDRMEQLLSTYLVTAKVLFFIMLSNLWKEIRNLDQADRQKILTDFYKREKLTEQNALDFDFLAGISKINAYLQSFDGQLFVPEIEKLCAELEGESPLNASHAYLEELQHRYQKLSEAELRQECVDAEEAVSIVLQQAAFLANYHMLTVRNILIDHSIFGQQEAYELDLGRLNAVVNTSLRLYDDKAYRRKDAYSNSRSVILAPNEDDFRSYLNLSPFIIDKNTHLNKSAIDLFLYAYDKDGHHHYMSINHSIYRAAANEKGTDIIHTGMTDVDFEEGRNIKKARPRRASRFGGHTKVQESVDRRPGKKVFELLTRQFEHFKTDLGLS